VIGAPFHLMRILEHDLQSWTSLGWLGAGRTYPQRLPCADVLVRWDWERPKTPEGDQ